MTGKSIANANQGQLISTIPKIKMMLVILSLQTIICLEILSWCYGFWWRVRSHRLCTSPFFVQSGLSGVNLAVMNSWVLIALLSLLISALLCDYLDLIAQVSGDCLIGNVWCLIRPVDTFWLCQTDLSLWYDYERVVCGCGLDSECDAAILSYVC